MPWLRYPYRCSLCTRWCVRVCHASSVPSRRKRARKEKDERNRSKEVLRVCQSKRKHQQRTSKKMKLIFAFVITTYRMSTCLSRFTTTARLRMTIHREAVEPVYGLTHVQGHLPFEASPNSRPSLCYRRPSSLVVPMVGGRVREKSRAKARAANFKIIATEFDGIVRESHHSLVDSFVQHAFKHKIRNRGETPLIRYLNSV
jgi:hypothetical protein